MHFFARVFLPLLLFVYIGIETYLRLQHTSLCGEVGCALAGELLRFDHIYLNYFGLAGVLSLIITGYRSLKSSFFETLFFILLYSGIAFETTIISYQFIANPEPCIFCLSVFSSLLLIALFSQIKHFATVLATVLFIFLALNTLNIPQNSSFVTTPGLYLIQSETCGHCKKVKKYFSEHQIAYTPISAKEINARGFLKFVDIDSIPVLIIKEASSITILKGDRKIIAHFDAQSKEEVLKDEGEAAPVQSSARGLSSDFLGAGGDAGCALTITDTPSCADNNATSLPQH
jgi:arsenate reductase-like glutaredoxin family protein